MIKSFSPVLSAAAMRRCEALNFEAHTANPAQMMKIAGTGCACTFRSFFYTLPEPQRQRIVILAGHGNNAGDGLVMAIQLSCSLPVPIEIQLAKPHTALSETAQIYFRQLPESVIVRELENPELAPGCVVIDALLGTGLQPPLRAPYDRWIAEINASSCPVWSIDLPSGLGCETAVRADETGCIGFFKDILLTADGIRHSGTLKLIPLPLAIAPEPPERPLFACDDSVLRAAACCRLPLDAHKYSRGSVLVLAGSRDYPGAAVLCGTSALRSGAGIVTLALPESCALPSGTPLALIVRKVPDDNGAFSGKSVPALTGLLPKIRVVAAGPGWGRNLETAAFFRKLLQTDFPLVLDADALFFAAQYPELVAARSALTVLTPHEGEARRLAEALRLPELDRLALVRELAEKLHAVVVLKGPRTLIASPERPEIFCNLSGVPALATAGSGDCLTGAIAAELALWNDFQDAETVQKAVALAIYCHGKAGELAVREAGPFGVIADDLPRMLGAVWR